MQTEAASVFCVHLSVECTDLSSPTLSFTICCQLSVLSFAGGGGEVMAIKYCSNKLGGFQSPFINSVNTTEHLLCTVPDILLV